MAIDYTTNLGLAKPQQGTEDGAWGTVVNNQITTLIEEAIAGKKDVNSWSSNAQTITTTDGASSIGRAAILVLKNAGGLTAAGTLTVPTVSKIFVVRNETSYDVTVKTSGGSGVVVPTNKSMIVLCDGTNVVEAANEVIGNLAVGGTLNVTGAATFSAAATVGTTLGVTGNVSVNTDKLVVTASNGNTTSAGTISAVNLTGSLTASVTGASGGAIDASGMTALIGKRIISDNSSNVTFTLPDAGSTDAPVGSTWIIVNAHESADITLQAANDNYIYLATGSVYSAGSQNGTRTITQGGVAELVVTHTDKYVVFGGGVS